ncbi:MAG: hypothetical protein ABSE59_08515 [Opitutaceae bacterium]|jgi:hypothetical protein
MDDIVAIKVRDSKEQAHYFLTWGRIFDRVDAKGLEVVITKHVSKFGIKNPQSVAVCDSLKKASKARYFYEAFFHLSREKIPFGVSTYRLWRAKKKKQILSGQQIFYCGVRKKKT